MRAHRAAAAWPANRKPCRGLPVAPGKLIAAAAQMPSSERVPVTSGRLNTPVATSPRAASLPWSRSTRGEPSTLVERGKVITAAGVSVGIDMALILLARMHGPQVAQGVQLAIEYDPQPPFRYRIAVESAGRDRGVRPLAAQHAGVAPASKHRLRARPVLRQTAEQAFPPTCQTRPSRVAATRGHHRTKEHMMAAAQPASPAPALPMAPARPRNGLGVAALVIGVASLSRRFRSSCFRSL
jgi:hypothetical protein